MKIAISSYGGFCLSDAAVVLYAKKKGIKLFKQKSSRGWFQYYTVPPAKRTNDDSSGRFWPGEIARDDPTLIQVIEELGSKANGERTNIEIVEHPDGLPWVVDDYDGQESLKFDLSLYSNMLVLSLTNEGMRDLLERCRVFYELAKKDTE